MERKTVGEQILEHNAKGIHLEDDVGAYSESMGSEIMNSLYDTALQARKSPIYHNKNFYIVLVKNVDRMLGQPKFQYFARLSCPTPVYKQDVWKYHHIAGDLEFLWCIPDSSRYWHIVRNPKIYLDKKDTARLAQFVILMESGELLEWVKRENGEKKDAIITINKGEN